MTPETVTCRICGAEDEPNYIEPVRSRMIDGSLCFSCAHWTEQIGAQDTDPTLVRAAGHQYHIGPEDQKGASHWRGFGGARATIRFTDGRVVVTTNLWNNGEIPERFRADLPDNATLEWG